LAFPGGWREGFEWRKIRSPWGDVISDVELNGKLHDMMNDSVYQGNDDAYPMNNDFYHRLLGIVSELSASRTGLRFLDRYFTEPTALGNGWLPRSAGVYAILVSDPAWQPRPYRPIYVGEAGDLAGRVAASHEKYEEWRRAAAAGTADQLYVAYHLMSGGDAERAALAGGLVQEYRPACNETASGSQRLAGGGSEARE
jgi:hypothetical protein